MGVCTTHQINRKDVDVKYSFVLHEYLHVQMEYVVASYLRQVCDMNDWLYKGQHGFRPGYSFESQVITVCQGTADSMDNGDRTDAIVIDFLKAFDLVPHDRRGCLW
jgi:hypothetical protein